MLLSLFLISCKSNKINMNLKTPKEDFISAVILNDHKSVARYIKEGVDLNAIFLKQSKDIPSEERVIVPRNKLVIKVLKENNAIVGVSEVIKALPLILASRRGNLEVVEELLRGGVEVDAVNNNGDTAMLEACKAGHINIVKALILSGADINFKNKQGESPLSLAITHRDTNLTKYLLSLAVDLKLAVNKDYTPLIIAIQYGHISILEDLVKKGDDVNAVAYDGYTPLHMAISLWSLEAIRILLSLGADINKKADRVDEHGIRNFTPLSFKKGDFNEIMVTVQEVLIKGEEKNIFEIMAKILLEKNEIMRIAEFTPLMLAILRDNPDIVNELLENGADPNFKNEEGMTAYMLPARPNIREALRSSAYRTK